MDHNIPRSTKISIILIGIIFLLLGILIPLVGGSKMFLLLIPGYIVFVAVFFILKPSDAEDIEAGIISNDKGSINLFSDDLIDENKGLKDMSAVAYIIKNEKQKSTKIIELSYQQVEELTEIKEQLMKSLNIIRKTDNLKDLSNEEMNILGLINRLDSFDIQSLIDIANIDKEEKNSEWKTECCKAAQRIAYSAMNNYKSEMQTLSNSKDKEKIARKSILKLSECKNMIEKYNDHSSEEFESLDIMLDYVKNKYDENPLTINIDSYLKEYQEIVYSHNILFHIKECQDKGQKEYSISRYRHEEIKQLYKQHHDPTAGHSGLNNLGYSVE